MAIDISRTRLGDWNVKWDAYDLGGVDKVTPDITMQTSDIKVGSVGDVLLGERITGVQGTVKVEAREIDRDLYAALMPWAGDDAISLVPAIVHKDLYDYAQLLTLHPTDRGNTDYTEDVNLIKAVPMIQFMDQDGKKDGVAIITFKFYPLRTVLPLLTYGYIGAVPS